MTESKTTPDPLLKQMRDALYNLFTAVYADRLDTPEHDDARRALLAYHAIYPERKDA